MRKGQDLSVKKKGGASVIGRGRGISLSKKDRRKSSGYE